MVPPAECLLDGHDEKARIETLTSKYTDTSGSNICFWPFILTIYFPEMTRLRTVVIFEATVSISINIYLVFLSNFLL